MTSLVYTVSESDVIVSYGNKDTERFAAGATIKAWESFRRRAETRLRILDAATSLADLAALNSNRPEALRGKREGQYSIRINNQWRIRFVWPSTVPGPLKVEIVDYHQGKEQPPHGTNTHSSRRNPRR